MGYEEAFMQFISGRTATTNAAYLLPDLKTGMCVLNIGCGPGTIPVGLAGAVDPGELHGIDMEESQVDIARATAAASGQDNATFQVGDVTKLPFEDEWFDAVHCHAVLMHIPDTMDVLAEVMRVLKPGGIVGAREHISNSSFDEPEIGNVADGWTMYRDLLTANGGPSSNG